MPLEVKEEFWVNVKKAEILAKNIINDAFFKKSEKSIENLEFDKMEKFIAGYGMIVIAVIVNAIGVYMCTIYKKKQTETVLSREELLKLPLLLSCSLFGIFCFLKIVSIEYITFAIQLYTLLYGFVSLGIFFGIFTPYFWPSFLTPNRSFKLSILENDADFYKTEIKFSDFLGYAISACIVVGYYLKKHWILNNLVAASFTFTLLDNITLDKFWHSFMLFSGLFFYDIFWVYGTNVMVTVAKKIDAPLMFKLPYHTLKPSVTIKYSGLGLGDVAVPGLFLAFLLRFDLSQKKNSYNYFSMGMGCYLVSLLICTMVVDFTGYGQPAFFYIVPLMFSGVFLLAIFRGEVSALMKFNADPNSEKDKEE